MNEEKQWQCICIMDYDCYTRITSRMEIEGGFLYIYEITREDHPVFPLAAVTMQFVPHAAKQVRKKHVKVKKKRH